jgi:hypothetical protein
MRRRWRFASHEAWALAEKKHMVVYKVARPDIGSNLALGKARGPEWSVNVIEFVPLNNNLIKITPFHQRLSLKILRESLSLRTDHEMHVIHVKDNVTVNWGAWWPWSLSLAVMKPPKNRVSV